MQHRITKNLSGGLLAAVLVAATSFLALVPFATRAHASDARSPSSATHASFTDDCDDDNKKNSQECKDKAQSSGNKVTLCHATGSSSNPYVTITISESGLNGHDGHAGDIIPAPAGGCPGATSANGSNNSNGSNSNPNGNNSGSNSNQGSRGEKVTLCHATGSSSNPYVTIMISVNGLNGHGGHAGDIIPAPAGGCPGAAVGTTTAGVTTTSTVVTPVVRESNGVEFIVYTVNGRPSTLVLLQALPQDTMVWQVGNMIYTAPAGTVTAASQTALLAELGPSLTAGQFASSLQVGPAPLPAATGSAGMLDEQSAATWLLLPVLLIAAAGARMASRKR